VPVDRIDAWASLPCPPALGIKRSNDMNTEAIKALWDEAFTEAVEADSDGDKYQAASDTLEEFFNVLLPAAMASGGIGPLDVARLLTNMALSLASGQKRLG
jgi:hypothetical protein